MSKFRKIIKENIYKKNFTNKKICFMSIWEIDFVEQFLEKNDNVVEWKSSYPIRYFDRHLSKQEKTYYVDFYVKTYNNIYLIEIKPMDSFRKNLNTKSITYKKIHYENYKKNLSKFPTIVNFCNMYGYSFFIVSKSKKTFDFYKWNIEKESPIFYKSVFHK